MRNYLLKWILSDNAEKSGSSTLAFTVNTVYKTHYCVFVFFKKKIILMKENSVKIIYVSLIPQLFILKVLTLDKI